MLKDPAFLLLGQAIDDLVGTVPEPSLAGTDAQAAYAEYDRMAAMQPVPQWLADAADYPWNGVFTSRIDSSCSNCSSGTGAGWMPTAQPQLGRHPRSSTSLQLRHLFGGLGLPEDEWPPADAIAEVESRARAAEMLSALADTIITPRGVLIIDGYRAG